MKNYLVRNQEICNLRKQGVTYAAISRKYEISSAMVAIICIKGERNEIIDEQTMKTASHILSYPRGSKELLDLNLINLGFTTRTINGLNNGALITVKDLLCKTEFQLLEIPNFGRKSLNEIKDTLLYMGFQLSPICKIEIRD